MGTSKLNCVFRGKIWRQNLSFQKLDQLSPSLQHGWLLREGKQAFGKENEKLSM